MFWFLPNRQHFLHNITFLDTCQKMVSTGLQALEYLCIGPLCLAIALWMSNRGEAELNDHVVTIIPKERTGELGPVVGDDSVRDAKT